jgi:hypothetical protein
LFDIQLSRFEEMAEKSLKDEREEFTLQIRDDRDIELREREPGGHPGKHYLQRVELAGNLVHVR